MFPHTGQISKEGSLLCFVILNPIHDSEDNTLHCTKLLHEGTSTFATSGVISSLISIQVITDISIISNVMISQTEKDIRNITDLVNTENKSILELGCGTGRITFVLAERVREIVAIDIDTKAIEDAQQRNEYENVTFLVENMETFDLKRKFDLVLSVGVGYMYLRNLPNAIENISHHLNAEGFALLICSSPNDEYQRIVDLLVEENVKNPSFYNEFEKLLSSHFTFEKRLLKEQLSFSDFREILRCFQRELKEEYQTDMIDRHEKELKEFFQRKGRLAVERDSQAFICRHH